MTGAYRMHSLDYVKGRKGLDDDGVDETFINIDLNKREGERGLDAS
jgi:hypothetical protein